MNFTTPGIQKLLEGVKEHTAAGPDKISPKVLKQLAKSIAPILALIFRKSHDTGTVSLYWQKANASIAPSLLLVLPARVWKTLFLAI